ncbi:hypothetical protein ONZ45_g16888 [Pleurotus djamor]|nr:hypothetical protein ONZ45_g16888 [Pleurotus djamor]
MSAREELLRNAVAFLSDPKSQSSSLAQRIQFLEAKGLTPSEIDMAMKQASSNQTVPTHAAGLPVYGPHYAPVPPPRPTWDWRDYFITAVVSGTIMYGAAAVLRKYLLPHLQPPSSTAYEGDRDALTAQFDAAEQLLKEIQSETAAVRTAVEKQQEEIDTTTKEVNAMVKEMRDGEVKTRDEMREIRDEVNTIRDMLPKCFFTHILAAFTGYKALNTGLAIVRIQHNVAYPVYTIMATLQYRREDSSARAFVDVGHV